MRRRAMLDLGAQLAGGRNGGAKGDTSCRLRQLILIGELRWGCPGQAADCSAGSHNWLHKRRCGTAAGLCSRCPTCATCSHLCCRGDPNKKWFARTLAFLTYIKRGSGGVPSHGAFVRWFAQVPGAATQAVRALPFHHLQLATREVAAAGGGTVEIDYHALIPMADIMQPVCLQHDPTTACKRWFHNSFL